MEEIKGKDFEAKNDGALRVRDFTEAARELRGLVKENYILGFQIALSFWDESLKMIKQQTNQALEIQESWEKVRREAFATKTHKETSNEWSAPAENHTAKTVTWQRKYSNALIDTTDKFIKYTFSVVGRGTERTLDLFGNYMR